jgi:hypothetical protein
MFIIRVHFTKSHLLAFRNKDRVITKSPLAPWRPDKMAGDFPLEGLNLTVGPGKR